MSLSVDNKSFLQEVASESASLLSSLETVIERDHVVIVTLVFLLLAGLMLRYVPSGRRHVRASLLLFGFAVIVMLGAVVLAVAGFGAIARAVHWAGLLIGGMAIVNLLSVLLFDVALKAVHLATPRILRDVLVGLGYIGVALLLMSRGGVSLSGIITTSAVITAVIGFALQDTLGNVMGGLAIQLEKTIQPGDWVRVDQQVGRVVEIRWRYTAIETRNWDTVLIPNGVLMKSQVLIYGRRGGETVNHRQTIYFNVDFRFAPSDVIAAVTQKLQADSIPGVATQPPPQCILMDFKESYGQYVVRYWLTDLAVDDPTDSQVRARVYYALRRRGIPMSIPASSIFMTEESESRRMRKREREIESRIQILSNVDIFEGLTQEERRKIAERMQDAPFVRGEALMRQGADGEWLYIITRGAAEVRIYSGKDEYKVVATLGAGDFLGEMSLLTGAKRSATVIATDETDCLRLDKEAFHEVLKSRPEIAEYLAEVLARRQTELDAAREGLDEESRRRAFSGKQRDLLSRIYHFFSLD
ncbi:MAG: mechanosensitive ion channel family protein [Acidobacteria bacterium]|nr:mechanosensitive ion channel family protein [Acidobacteriota bacterium]